MRQPSSDPIGLPHLKAARDRAVKLRADAKSELGLRGGSVRQMRVAVMSYGEWDERVRRLNDLISAMAEGRGG